MTDDTNAAFDLRTTFVHLGLGARAIPLPDFSWDAEYLAGYDRRFASDGVEGRLVTLGEHTESWSTWERHPAGEEVVVVLSGRADLIQEIDGEERRIELGPGQAVVNPPGVWHTSDVHEPGQSLFITPGKGTEHRPR
jgi:mannose-6-phosphate isomerase-like protein (cupin superfamily)